MIAADAAGLAADAAELREVIAGLRREAGELAASMRTMATAVSATEWVTQAIAAARLAGRAEALAERDAYEATARAQQARTAFRVVPSRPAPRKGTPTGGA